MLSVFGTSQAIVRLDNVPDSDYINFGAQSQFAAVGRVDTTSAGGSALASGTLIAPQWVLTAAHVPAGSTTRTFTVGGNTYTGDSYFLRSGGSGYSLEDGTDMALIHLSTAVGNVAPMELFNADPLGMLGYGIGFGQTGTGTGGAGGPAGTKRGGTNMIDANPDFGNGVVNTIVMADFDDGTAGNNITGSATPTDLEFCVAPGDSGGALVVLDNGVYKLAGETSFRATNNNNNPNSGYGNLSGWVTVNGNYDWIASTAGVPEPTTMVLAFAGLAGLAAKRRKKA